MRLLVTLTVLAASPAMGQYTATDLNTAAFAPTMGQSVSGNYQAGVGTVAGQPRALVWNPSLNLVTDLTPSGYAKAYGLGISGVETVGQGVTTSGKTVALLWSVPSAGSVINLNPTLNGVALSLSVASGISGNQQVGYGQFSTGAGFALLWNGTAASAVNLNPSGYVDSQAVGTSGTQQVGYADVTVSGNSHAMLWSGTAASAVDLHPTAGYAHSWAEAVSGPYQVGFAQPIVGNGTGPYQAFLWQGNAASATNLNPPGFTSSLALGVANGLVVGYGSTSAGVQEALLWQGSATHYTNLSAFLPVGATNAQARGIDSFGNIIGYATVGGQTHAFLWKPSLAPSFTNLAQTATTLVNLSYKFTFTTSGTPASTYGITSGSLPTGLNLSTSGVISGTPTQTGSYSATITASNGVAPAATQNFSLTVVPNPAQQQFIAVSSWAYSGGYGLTDLTQGFDGNFYAGVGQGSFTTAGAGAVGKITLGGALTILHTFRDGSVTNDGADPNGVVVKPDGSLYGTTWLGGIGNGVLYKIAGGVTTTLHSFADGSIAQDGMLPIGNLLRGSDGNFYGACQGGGNGNRGVIYKSTTDGTITILHVFADGTVANDGFSPHGGLTQALDGNFYGTTFSGGSSSSGGTVYKVTPQGTETILHAFGDGSVTHDGLNPTAQLVQGMDGNFYGTTLKGGLAGKGTIFRLTPLGVMTILHSFGDGTVGDDGVNNGSDQGGLVQGPDGNFYGLSEYGGSDSDGMLYQITPQGTMLVLHNFASTDSAGYYPDGLLTLASDGNFYGNAGSGGAGYGTLFKFSVQSAPVFADNPANVNGTAGTAYNFSFTALGSPAPMFTLTSGALPPGLTLSATGVLSGVPTQAGTFTGTVTASNGIGTAATQTFTIVIAQPTDTPTLPVWGEIVLAGLLVIATAQKRATSRT